MRTRIKPNDVLNGHLSVCAVRILIAAHKAEEARASAGIIDRKPLSLDEIGQLVEKDNLKSYSPAERHDGVLQLEVRELFSGTGTNGSSRYLITDDGVDLSTVIRKLASKKPDPWRKFTRPSYSPDCQATA